MGSPSGQEINEILSTNESDQVFVNPVYRSSDEIEITPNDNNHSSPTLINYDENQLINSFDGHFKPITISWDNLNVHSKPSSGLVNLFANPKEPVHIIKDVSGHCEPGNLLAILGPSGAGKTTLLNVLTGQNLRNVTINGQVLLNNEPTTIERLSTFSSYVQQDDLFFGYLTVKEHLNFQLKMRSPVKLTNHQINEKVDNLLERLGLLKVANSRINCDRTGQKLSGGERKRLSIATEILTDPSILFADEPTSGLDSFMALSAIQVLKSLSSENRTVICTIHQPSSEIFKLFDKFMLIAGGQVAFFGTSGQAIDFFSSLNLNCPSNYNPPDFFIQQLSVNPGNEIDCRAKVKAICDSFGETEYFATLKKQIHSNDGEKLTNHASNQLDNNLKSLKPPACRQSVWTQFSLLLWRATIINLRDPMLLISRISFTLFSVFIISSIFWAQEYNQEGIMNINGAIFVLITNSNFTNIFIVINTFCLEIPIFLREHAAGLYRVSVYFMARTLADQPFFIILPVILWSASYYAIGLYNEFNTFLLGNVIMVMSVNAASGFGYFISSISTSLTMGLEISSPLQAPLVLLGGSFLNPATIPIWLKWFKYVSWIFYSNEILTVNQWQHVTSIDCDYEMPSAISNILPFNVTLPETGQGCLINGDQVIKSVGFDRNNLKFDYIMLAVVVIIFRLMSYLALLVRSKLRR